MKCKCGGTFDINPRGEDRVENGGAESGPDKIETTTLSVIDAKRDGALVIIVDCPFCGGVRSRMIRYNELLDMPGPHTRDGSPSIIVGRSRWGNPFEHADRSPKRKGAGSVSGHT